ncbi:MAG: hypothetical protein ACO1QR_06750 [Chthoniobacteraceae bacterium]
MLALKLVAAIQRERSLALREQSAKAERLGRLTAGVLTKAKSSDEIDPLLQQTEGLLGSDEQLSPIPAELQTKLTQLRDFLTLLQTSFAHHANGAPSAAVEHLSQVRAQFNDLPWVAAEELVEIYQQLARRFGRPSAEEIEKMVKAAVDKVLQAGKSAELDPLIEEVQRTQTFLRADHGNESRQQINQLLRFIEGWQNALVLLEAGNAPEFHNAAVNIQSYGSTNLGFPRSSLVTRMNDLIAAKITQSEGGAARPAGKFESPEKVLERMVRLEDLQPNMHDLNVAINLADQGNALMSEWQRLIIALDAIAKQYEQLKAGLTVNADSSIYIPEIKNARIPALRAQLVTLALQRSVGDEVKVVPEPAETVVDYVGRILKAAREEKRWELLHRTIVLARSLSIDAPFYSETDVAALSALLRGDGQERAGQFAFATESYQETLENPSSWAPAEEVGARLQRIEKEHPQEYKQGVEWSKMPKPVAAEEPYSPAVTIQVPGGIMHRAARGKKPEAPTPETQKEVERQVPASTP